MPYLIALEVWSRQGAIQIHVYLYLYSHHYLCNLDVAADAKLCSSGRWSELSRSTDEPAPPAVGTESHAAPHWPDWSRTSGGIDVVLFAGHSGNIVIVRFWGPCGPSGSILWIMWIRNVAGAQPGGLCNWSLRNMHSDDRSVSIEMLILMLTKWLMPASRASMLC